MSSGVDGARVLVAMSGGVDSSVAAALLVEAGHDVVGVTMKTFCYSGTGDHGKTCCGLDGIVDARRVADGLGIPHYVFDVEQEFERDVIDDFVSEYVVGRTPNPCVRCNSFTKFRDLMARGEQLGCAAIATGHYVIAEGHGADRRLRRGRDLDKDQAYFLWGLPRGVLPRLEFPLGGWTKQEVRGHAHAQGLVTADKPESQEICFVPTGDYRDLLRERLDLRHPALQPGSIVDEQGQIVGRHQGYAGFTIGQRKGLGGGHAEAVYVVAIRPDTREVVVGARSSLDVDHMEVDALNWLAEPPAPGSAVSVQVRHRASAVPARIEHLADEALEMRLMDGGTQVTPGQSAVIFEGDRLLGGGRIVRSLSA